MNECYYMGMSLMALFMSLFPTTKLDAPETTVSAKPPAYLAYHCEVEGVENQYQLSLERLFSQTQAPRYGEGFACLDASAKGGHPKAQFFLGMAFNEGVKVKEAFIVQDKAQARYWLEQSAKQGDGEAQLYLARLYQVGQGGNADGTLARYWFEKSARQGSIDAQKELATFYLNGKNHALAYQWFRIAEKQLLALKDVYRQDNNLRLRLSELKKHLDPAEMTKMDAIVATWQPQVQQQFGDTASDLKASNASGVAAVVLASPTSKASKHSPSVFNLRLNLFPLPNAKKEPPAPVDPPAL